MCDRCIHAHGLHKIKMLSPCTEKTSMPLWKIENLDNLTRETIVTNELKLNNAQELMVQLDESIFL